MWNFHFDSIFGERIHWRPLVRECARCFYSKTVGDATPVAQTVCLCVPSALNEIKRYENGAVSLRNDDLPIKNGVRVDFRFALCSTQNKNSARN